MNTISILSNCRKKCKQGNLVLYKAKISSSTNTIQESASMRYAAAVRNNASRILPKISCLANSTIQFKGQSSQFVQQQILLQQQQQQQLCNIQARYYQASGKNIPLSKMVCITRPQMQRQTVTNFPLYQIPNDFTPVNGGFQYSNITKNDENVITKYSYLDMVRNNFIDPNNPIMQNFSLTTLTNTTTGAVTFRIPPGFNAVPGGFINYNYNNGGNIIIAMVITDPNMPQSTIPGNIIQF